MATPVFWWTTNLTEGLPHFAARVDDPLKCDLLLLMRTDQHHAANLDQRESGLLTKPIEFANLIDPGI